MKKEVQKLLDKKAGYMGAFSRLFRQFLKDGKPNTKHILPTFYQLTKYCEGTYKNPHQMFLNLLKNDDAAWEKFFTFADELRPGFLFDVRSENALKRIPIEIVLKKRNKQQEILFVLPKSQKMDLASFKNYLEELEK